MKPINNRAVKKAYLKFSGYLMICVGIAVFTFYSFMKTSSVEVKAIINKTAEYDRIYTDELNLVVAFDSIYQYMNLMNSSPRINDILLQDMVSSRKMQFQRHMGKFDAQDYILHQRLLNAVNDFLAVKDSIRLAEKEENVVREDLMRSVKEYKDVSRKLKVGGLVYERK